MNKRAKSVLITGGGGFIGTNLTRKLLKLNCEVHLILKTSTNLWRLKEVLPKINLHKVNLLEKKKLFRTAKQINPKIIYHLATYSAYRNQEDLEKMTEVNIQGTLNLLLATKEINYDIFINTGSSSEYGFKKKPMKETDLLEPVSFYAVSKASATLLCQVFAQQYQKPILTFRPFSVYGPYEESSRFIPTIIQAVIKNKPIKLTPGKVRRDFIYIEDLINAYTKLLRIKNPKKLAGRILNLGTGREYTNNEVVETLFKVTGQKVSIERGAYPKRIWDTAHWKADVSLVKKKLNWKPKFSLEEGLKNTFSWFLKNQSLYEKPK